MSECLFGYEGRLSACATKHFQPEPSTEENLLKDDLEVVIAHPAQALLFNHVALATTVKEVALAVLGAVSAVPHRLVDGGLEATVSTSMYFTRLFSLSPK